MSPSSLLKPLIGAALLAAASLACRAAVFAPDPTGFWHNPSESGWGLTVAKQGDTAFATLLVYDEAKRPTWYVASDLHAFTIFPDPDLGITNYVGTLYRTAGPWFGGPFDPHAVTVAEAGPMELHPLTDGTMTIVYGIGGTTYEKTVQRLTWGSNLARLTGGKAIGESVLYAGGPSITSSSPASCPAPNLGGAADEMPSRFGVSPGVLPGHVIVGWGTGSDTACVIEGAYAQSGQLGSIAGHMRCGPISGLPSAADPPASITGIVANEHGFAGGFAYQAGACSYAGHIGGVRVAD
jgi:hypothetical protein